MSALEDEAVAFIRDQLDKLIEATRGELQLVDRLDVLRSAPADLHSLRRDALEYLLAHALVRLAETPTPERTSV